MSDEKTVTIALLKDNSRIIQKSTGEALYQILYGEIFNPKDSRTHVLTFHLYVEYWMDKILLNLGLSTKCRFSEKIKTLTRHDVLEANLVKNIYNLNKIRNLYCHELDIEQVIEKVQELVTSMHDEPYIRIEDDFYLRKVCAKTLILLEATFNNNCKPPKLDIFPHEKIRQELNQKKRVLWSDCEIISEHNEGNNITRWEITCPSCNKELIVRYKDSTHGFKESSSSKCNSCGLTGDGNYLYYDK